MTGYTVHTGSTEKFAEGFDRVFGGAKKEAAAKPAAKKSAVKKGARKSAKAKKSKAS